MLFKTDDGQYLCTQIDQNLLGHILKQHTERRQEEGPAAKKHRKQKTAQKEKDQDDLAMVSVDDTGKFVFLLSFFFQIKVLSYTWIR